MLFLSECGWWTENGEFLLSNRLKLHLFWFVSNCIIIFSPKIIKNTANKAIRQPTTFLFSHIDKILMFISSLCGKFVWMAKNNVFRWYRYAQKCSNGTFWINLHSKRNFSTFLIVPYKYKHETKWHLLLDNIKTCFSA